MEGDRQQQMHLQGINHIETRQRRKPKSSLTCQQDTGLNNKSDQEDK